MHLVFDGCQPTSLPYSCSPRLSLIILGDYPSLIMPINLDDPPTTAGRPSIAVFWDLQQTHGTLNRNVCTTLLRIADLVHSYGDVTHTTAYTTMKQDPRVWSGATARLFASLDKHDVKLLHLPRSNSGKSTIWHGIESDIAFHFALDHPEDKTAVLITGERDFTYLVDTLKRHGKRIVVLVMNGTANDLQEIADPSSYYPRIPLSTRERQNMRTAEMEEYRAEIKTRRKKHRQMVFEAKSRRPAVAPLISLSSSNPPNHHNINRWRPYPVTRSVTKQRREVRVGSSTSGSTRRWGHQEYSTGHALAGSDRRPLSDKPCPIPLYDGTRYHLR